MRVPFQRYAPDLPPFGNPGVSALKNVIPHAGGYRPLPSLDTYSDALGARCQGAVFTTDASGNVNGFAGDSSALYRLSGGTTAWADVSKTGGYSTPTEGFWDFAKFGERIIATNLADPVQSFVIGSSTDFADLGGSPPQAKFVATIPPRFVLLGFLTSEPERVQWSAIGDPTNWPTPGTSAARIVQSDRNDLRGDGGAIQGLASGLAAADAAIVQERALWRMVYVGGRLLYAFDKVEGGRGTPAPGSLVQLGGVLFYLGEDGFYRFDGQSSVPIGGSRVDRTFFDEVESTKYHLMRAGADPINKLIIWAYPTDQDNVCKKLLIYNWEIDEWSPGELETEEIMRSLTFGVDLDTDLNANETLLDDPDWPSLDSAFWKGGAPGLAAFDGDHELAFFTGSPLDAELETGEADIEGSVIRVDRLRPLIETNGASPTIMCQVASRYRLTDPPVYKQAYAPTVEGFVFARSRGRYHRIKATISGDDWEFAQGVDIYGRASGMRGGQT